MKEKHFSVIMYWIWFFFIQWKCQSASQKKFIILCCIAKLCFGEKTYKAISVHISFQKGFYVLWRCKIPRNGVIVLPELISGEKCSCWSNFSALKVFRYYVFKWLSVPTQGFYCYKFLFSPEITEEKHNFNSFLDG